LALSQQGALPISLSLSLSFSLSDISAVIQVGDFKTADASEGGALFPHNHKTLVLDTRAIFIERCQKSNDSLSNFNHHSSFSFLVLSRGFQPYLLAERSFHHI
jgi:hypothetical protein